MMFVNVSYVLLKMYSFVKFKLIRLFAQVHLFHYSNSQNNEISNEFKFYLFKHFIIQYAYPYFGLLTCSAISEWGVINSHYVCSFVNLHSVTNHFPLCISSNVIGSINIIDYNIFMVDYSFHQYEQLCFF
jgi:hypothetical protein